MLPERRRHMATTYSVVQGSLYFPICLCSPTHITVREIQIARLYASIPRPAYTSRPILMAWVASITLSIAHLEITSQPLTSPTTQQADYWPQLDHINRSQPQEADRLVCHEFCFTMMNLEGPFLLFTPMAGQLNIAMMVSSQRS